MKKYIFTLSITSLLFILAVFISSCDDSGVITPVGTAGKSAKTYGGGLSDILTSMISLNDGGLMTGGFTVSFGAGNNDFYVTRLTSGGDIAWSKAYGSTGNDVCTSVAQTTDGGFILTGNTNGAGASGVDVLLVKTDATGNLTWSADFVIPNDQFPCSVIQDADGGYLICGYSNELGVNNADVFIIKASSTGHYAWEKLYGGLFNDVATKMIKTSDGGFLVGGLTFSFGAPLGDIYLLKLKSDCSFDWSNIYGGSEQDQAYGLTETAGHDFMVSGFTQSFGLGDGEMILFKTDHSGNVYTSEGWPRTVGDSSGLDIAMSVAQATDGSFYITGFTTNAAGNTFISFAHYFSNSVFDFFHSYGGPTDNGRGMVILPLNNGFVVGGFTASGGIGNNDIVTIGFPDSSGRSVTCLTENTFSPRGGSPVFNVVAAPTQSSVPATESDLFPNLTVTTAGTVKNIICGQ